MCRSKLKQYCDLSSWLVGAEWVCEVLSGGPGAVRQGQGLGSEQPGRRGGGRHVLWAADCG